METERQRLARLIERASKDPRLLPVSSIKDRTWIFYEYDTENGLWRAVPTGLAILSLLSSPSNAAETFQNLVPCKWSYELIAELMTGVSAKLLIEANKAHGKYSLIEMIALLKADQKLINYGSGPPIIDPIIDSDN